MTKKKILSNMDKSDIVPVWQKRVVEVWEEILKCKYICEKEFKETIGERSVDWRARVLSYGNTLTIINEKFPFLKSREEREKIKNG